jgi:transcriptional regulator with XRE-family HTH domain
MYDFAILRELRKRAALTIADVSQRSGISPAVISKLERNQTQADIRTLFKLGRVFGMTAAELLTLAEFSMAHRKEATSYEVNGFAFRRVDYANVRCMMGSARAGAILSRPEVHRDDYEVCWVLSGKLKVNLPHERHVLGAGDALQFDAIFEHGYEVVEDCTVLLVHVLKGKRF